MTQSSVFPLAVATAVVQQLQAVLDSSSQPCLDLRQQLSALTARFLCAPITPAAALDFETALRQLLDECGRLIVQSVFNQIEPANPDHFLYAAIVADIAGKSDEAIGWIQKAVAAGLGAAQIEREPELGAHDQVTGIVHGTYLSVPATPAQTRFRCLGIALRYCP